MPGRGHYTPFPADYLSTVAYQIIHHENIQVSFFEETFNWLSSHFYEVHVIVIVQCRATMVEKEAQVQLVWGTIISEANYCSIFYFYQSYYFVVQSSPAYCYYFSRAVAIFKAILVLLQFCYCYFAIFIISSCYVLAIFHFANFIVFVAILLLYNRGEDTGGAPPPPFLSATF